jgi:hypothetical protein
LVTHEPTFWLVLLLRRPSRPSRPSPSADADDKAYKADALDDGEFVDDAAELEGVGNLLPSPDPRSRPSQFVALLAPKYSPLKLG